MSISRECESKFYSSLTTEERRAEMKPTAAASSERRKKGSKRGKKKQGSLPKEWSPCVILSLYQHWSKALAKCEALLWWKGTVLISALTCSIIELWGRSGERGVSTHLWSHCCDILLSFRVLSATLAKLLLLVVYTYIKATGIENCQNGIITLFCWGCVFVAIIVTF